MVHKVFDAVTLFEKFPLKIESLGMWGSTKLVIGTSEGALLAYDISETGELNKSPKLVGTSKSFSKKPILQVDVIQDLSIIISLSEMITIHELHGFDAANVTPRSSLVKTKGCYLYALDRSRPSSLNLCACLKKRLIIYQLEGREFVERKELQIPDVAKSVAWCGNNLCVGFKREYALISVQTGEIKEIGPKLGTAPSAILLPNDELLAFKDNVGFFVNSMDGKPTRKYGIHYSEVPVAVDHQYPFVVGVFSKTIEVRAIYSPLTAVQILNIKNIRFITRHSDCLYVGSTNSISRLKAVPVGQQITQLLAEKQYEEALGFLEMVPEHNVESEKIREIKIMHGYNLFSQAQYDKAMDHFTELHVDPLEVMNLFSILLPKLLRDQYMKRIEIPELKGEMFEQAFRSLAQYLRAIRPTIIQKELKRIQQRGGIEELYEQRPGQWTLPTTGATTGMGLSTLEKLRTLPVLKEEIETVYANVTNPIVIIDTTLVLAYAKLDPSLLTPFLEQPDNHCHIKESKGLLTKLSRFRDVVELYRGKGLHKEALEALRDLDAEGRKPDSTIRYLRELDARDWPLITEFSRWVIDADPAKSLQIFTVNRKEHPLDTTLVADFLKKYDKLIVPYLEWLIEEKKDNSPKIHNELIMKYLRTIEPLQNDPFYSEPEKTGPVRVQFEVGLLGETRRKLLNFLKSSQFYSPETMMARSLFKKLPEERAILLCRLERHEEVLHIYAQELGNREEAEKYCNDYYDPQKEECKDVFASLVKVYLKPMEGYPVREEPAFQILNKYYKKISPAKAFELIPDNTPITRVQHFLESVTQDYTSTRRNNGIIKNILKTAHLEMREKEIRVRAAALRITEDLACPVCAKKIGTSVFARYPNGIVVHLACCKDKSVCPVTGEVFSSQKRN